MGYIFHALHMLALTEPSTTHNLHLGLALHISAYFRGFGV